MAELVFASYKEAQKIVLGVKKALNEGQPKRPLFLQSFYPPTRLVNSKTINFDEQFAMRNVMGTFAVPTADVNPVALQNFGHVETYFSYAKETVTSGDEADEDIADQRQYAGQDFNVNYASNRAYRLQQKFTLAEQRLENLQELVATHNVLYGGYSSASEYHPAIVYNWGRTVATVYTEIFGSTALDVIPSVNLTTTAVTAPWDSSQSIMPVISSGGSYTAGQKEWTTAKVDAGTATPYLDLIKMVQTCVAWGGTPEAIQLSADAYTVLNYDINKNYKDAADVNIFKLQLLERDLLPRIANIDGVEFVRVIAIGDTSTDGKVITSTTSRALPIFINRSVYHNRSSAAKTNYVGNGWASVIPSQSSFAKANGRIKHPKAMYQPMERWINYWMNDKSGIEEWEWHTNFVMLSTNINAVVTWKVITAA